MGKNKAKKIAPAAAGVEIEAVPPPVAAEADAAGHAAPQNGEELARLNAALEAERAARAKVEARLLALEAELRKVERAKPAPVDLGLATLQADAKPSAKAKDFSGFETWMLEAQMRSDAAASAPAPAPAPRAVPRPAHLPPAPPIAAPRDTIDTSAAEERLLHKLRSAREALETAEARAAHNASQVRRLSAELAAARSEHMRASTRLQKIEARLAASEEPPAPEAFAAPQAAATAKLVEEFTAPASVFVPAESPFDLPASPAPRDEEMAQPSADTGIEGALSIFGEAKAAHAEGASESALADALAGWGAEDEPSTSPSGADALSDALAGFGTEEPGSEEQGADALHVVQAGAQSPDLSAALEMFGAEEAPAEATAADLSAALEDFGVDESPAPAHSADLDAALEVFGAQEEQPSKALGDALEVFGAMGEGDAATEVFDATIKKSEVPGHRSAETRPPAQLPALESSDIEGLVEVMAESGAITMTQSEMEIITHEKPESAALSADFMPDEAADDAFPQQAPEPESVPSKMPPPGMYDDLIMSRPVRRADEAALRDVLRGEAETAPPEPKPARRHGNMADALHVWSDPHVAPVEASAPQDATLVEPDADGAKPEGRAAMVQALMRFMGTK